MQYRRAYEKDIQGLKELGLVSYGQLKIFMSLADWDKMESVIISDSTFPKLVHDSYGFICENENHLLGMAFLVPSGNPTKIYSDDTCYIRMVGVHPDAGGQGIAQHLTRLCMEKAKANGEKKISLHSAEKMYAARHVYEKAGFQKIRLLDKHYGLEYWLYEMNLSL